MTVATFKSSMTTGRGDLPRRAGRADSRRRHQSDNPRVDLPVVPRDASSCYVQPMTNYLAESLESSLRDRKLLSHPFYRRWKLASSRVTSCDSTPSISVLREDAAPFPRTTRKGTT